MNRPAPITAGWVCVGLSLLLSPIALVAFILGLVAVVRGATTHGTAIMVASVVSVILAYVLYGVAIGA